MVLCSCVEFVFAGVLQFTQKEGATHSPLYFPLSRSQGQRLVLDAVKERVALDKCVLLPPGTMLVCGMVLTIRDCNDTTLYRAVSAVRHQPKDVPSNVLGA